MAMSYNERKKQGGSSGAAHSAFRRGWNTTPLPLNKAVWAEAMDERGQAWAQGWCYRTVIRGIERFVESPDGTWNFWTPTRWKFAYPPKSYRLRHRMPND